MRLGLNLRLRKCELETVSCKTASDIFEPNLSVTHCPVLSGMTLSSAEIHLERRCIRGFSVWELRHILRWLAK